ncbi:MAG: hypothetical protein KAZ28_06705 [Bacteroidaceae bacterium]|jgi:hypothetical protein|nr:hypothetical protein [Bacteroidaceae bacterium]
MVRGLEQFKAFFSEFEDNYVIIGGTACEIHEEIYAQTPRATKDIDVILIVEALSKEFVSRFWEFVKKAQYGEQNKGIVERQHQKHEYYRFMNPANKEYPYQVELFSRNFGLIDFPEYAHITPIPVSEDLSSLSAILMNDDYYHFTIEHSRLENGIHIANIESLICLKCKAYLEMTERKAHGDQIDSKHIAKHKKDVFRLAAMLGVAESFTVPKQLADDISRFCEETSDDLPNADFIKTAGLGRTTGENLLQQLKKSFLIS